jgi:hypothetical protein
VHALDPGDEYRTLRTRLRHCMRGEWFALSSAYTFCVKITARHSKGRFCKHPRRQIPVLSAKRCIYHEMAMQKEPRNYPLMHLGLTNSRAV